MPNRYYNKYLAIDVLEFVTEQLKNGHTLKEVAENWLDNYETVNLTYGNIINALIRQHQKSFDKISQGQNQMGEYDCEQLKNGMTLKEVAENWLDNYESVNLTYGNIINALIRQHQKSFEKISNGEMNQMGSYDYD